MSTLTIYTDGGARGNPGPAASAFHTGTPQAPVAQGSKYLGAQTNNYAEYIGVVLALDWLIQNNPQEQEIHFFLDSQLVVRQLNKEYKIKEPTLQKLSQEIFSKIFALNKYHISFQHIPREQNKHADFLVNQCLDQELV